MNLSGSRTISIDPHCVSLTSFLAAQISLMGLLAEVPDDGSRCLLPMHGAPTADPEHKAYL